MKTLSLVWPGALLAGWVLAIGCDDNRPVVDLPVGGESGMTAGQGNAGEPAVGAGGTGALGGADGTGALGGAGTEQGGEPGEPTMGGAGGTGALGGAGTEQGGEPGEPTMGGAGGEGGS